MKISTKVNFFSIPVLLLILIFLVVYFSQINSVTVEVFKVDCVSIDQLKKELNLKGKNFFVQNSEQIKERIQSRHVCISDVNLSYKLPNKLEIKVIGREPKILLKERVFKEASSSSIQKDLDTETESSSDSGLYVSDRNGFIYSKTDAFLDLPLIEVVEQDLEIKKSFPNIASNSIDVLEKLKDMSLIATNIMVYNNSLEIGSHPKLKFTLNGDLDRQIASLQLILQKAKMKLRFSPNEMKLTQDSEEKKEIEMVDLRFDKPVIVYTQKNVKR